MIHTPIEGLGHPAAMLCLLESIHFHHSENKSTYQSIKDQSNMDIRAKEKKHNLCQSSISSIDVASQSSYIIVF